MLYKSSVGLEPPESFPPVYSSDYYPQVKTPEDNFNNEIQQVVYLHGKKNYHPVVIAKVENSEIKVNRYAFDKVTRINFNGEFDIAPIEKSEIILGQCADNEFYLNKEFNGIKLQKEDEEDIYTILGDETEEICKLGYSSSCSLLRFKVTDEKVQFIN